MKKILLFLLTLTLGFSTLQLSAQETVEIGDGTSTTYVTPFNSLWGYSFVEQIYTAAEIDMSGNITSISFNCSSSDSQTNNITVYMKNVSRSTFSSSSDYESVTAADIVYSGSWSFSQGWNTITLDVPFLYDGSSNLLIAMHEYTSGYSSRYFYYTSTTDAVISFHSDSNDPDPYNLGSFNGSSYTSANRANIRMEILPFGNTCYSPTFPVISDITSDEATLSWTPREGQTTWEVYCDTGVIDLDQVTWTTVTDTFYTFTGLQGATHYNAYVRTVCGTETSNYRTTDFYTSCTGDAMPIPFSEDFESTWIPSMAFGQTHDAPLCWAIYDGGATSTSYQWNWRRQTTTHSGSASAGCYTDYNTGGTHHNDWLITPPIELTGNQQVKFYAQRSSSTTNEPEEISIWISDEDVTLTAPTSTTSPLPGFTQVTQFNIPVGEWQLYEIPLTDYSGNRRVAFVRRNSPDDGYWLRLDDITIDDIPTCMRPVYNSVTTSHVSATTANVDWTPNDETDSWEIVVVPTGADVATGTPEPASTHPFTVSDLNDNTTYDVYVRTVCGYEEYSDWTAPATFTTHPFCTSPIGVTISQITGTSAMVSWNEASYGANSYTVEYSVANQNNWISTIVDGTSYMLSNLEPDTAYDVMVYSNCDPGSADTVERTFHTNCLVGGNLQIGEGTSTSSYLPEYCNYNYSYTQQIYLSSELGGAAEISSIAFNASTIANANRHLKIYLMHTSAANSNWLNASNATLVYDNTPTLTTGWNTFNFTTPFQYDGSSNLAVIVIDATGTYSGVNYFYCHTTNQSLAHYIYQDSSPYSVSTTPSSGSSATTTYRNNVIFGTPCEPNVTCVRPNVYVTEVTAESITVSWAPGYTETAWEIEYSEDNTNWTSAGTANTTSYELTGLEPNTNYMIRVRSNCGSEESEWSTVTTTTECSGVNIPLIEDFNNASGSGAGNMVSCWTPGTNNPSSAYPTISTTSHSSSYSAYFYGSSTYYSYLASPLFNDDVQMDNLQVRFWGYKSTDSYYIQVGIMTDPHDYSSFVQVGQDLTPSAPSTWEMLEVNTSDYTGNGKYIAFRIPASINSYMYVDDIVIEEIPTCTRPTQLTIEDFDAHSATISWSSDESAFNVYCKAANATNYTIANDSPVYDTTYTITGLNADTYYDIYVSSICSDETEVSSVSISLRTPCDVIVAPYTENFTGFNVNPSVCWEKYLGLASAAFSGTNPSATTSGWYFTSSDVFPIGHPKLNIYGTSCNYWLVSPSIDLSQLTNPALTLNIALTDFANSNPIENPGSQTDDKFMVIISTDGGATWSAANATVWDNTSSGNYSYDAISHTGDEFVIPLSQYAGQTVRIAFYGESTEDGGDNDLHIGNVVVEEMTSCVKPVNLIASETGSNSITLSWQELGESSSWNVAYGPSPLTLNDDTPYETVYDTTIIIDELTAGQNYDFYVQSICDDGVSTWRGPLTVAPGVFTFGTTGSSSITACGLIVYDNGGPNGNYSSNCNYTLTVYPSDPDSVVSVSGTFAGESTWDYLEIYDGTTTNDVLLEQIMSGTGSSGTVVNFGPITSETGPLTLRFYSDGSNQYAGFAATISCVEAPDCRTPYGLTANNIAADEATITWTADEGATLELYYKENSDTTWTVVTASEFTDVNTYLMTNLTPATTYNVYVANICTDDTLKTNVLTFSTPCVTLVVTDTEPFSENFNVLTAGIPNCWDNSEGTTTDNSYKWNYYSSGESGAGLRFNSYINSNGRTNMLKTPVLDLTAVSTPMLSFSYKNPTGGDFSVFLSTNGGVTYTTPIATGLTGTTNWTEVEYNLTNLTDADNVVIVFKGTSNYGSGDAYIYLDNVFVGNAPSCPKPTQLAVTGTTSSSVTLSWTPGNEETEWEIVYGTPGFDPTLEGTTLQGITTDTFTVSNLTHSTQYEFYVIAVCSATDHSYLSNSITQATDCGAITAPYTENFTSFVSGLAPCWEKFSGLASDVFAGGALTSTTSGWIFSSNNVYPTGHPKVNIYGTSCKYWLVTPAIDLSQLSNPALMFNLALTDYGNANPIEDPTAQADDQFMVIISTDNGATWSASNATVWNNDSTGNYAYNSISHTGDSITIPLSQYAGQTIKIAFYGESTASGGDNDLHIANLVVDENSQTPTEPTVTTNDATGFTQTSATLNATITNPSGVTITAKGFEWKQTVGGSYTTIAGTGTGNNFTANLTGLTANTNYTFRAFITFNGTTVTGDEMTFTTLDEGQQTCDMPTNLNATATAYNTANVTWTAGGSETSWNLQYRTGTANWTTLPVNATTYQITGLAAQTTYEVRVQANCGNNNTSDWTAAVSFTTPAAPVDPCDAPTNLQVNSITQTSATMTWTAGGSETSWKVGYKLSSASQWQEATVQTTSYNIEGLTAASTYDVRVKAICSADNQSDFVSTTFTTQTVGIDNITLANSINLMPNPADNYIDLNVNSNVEVKEAVVYNAFGQMIQKVELNNNHTRIDLSDMAAGMYFVRVNSDNVSATKKFIKR
ncbi:MAG: fibronectin type III domain-containing protein [Bacteroidales bacterium]|nr:fibronectin type III domain-containing protein [Bacteroidales bacterium]